MVKRPRTYKNMRANMVFHKHFPPPISPKGDILFYLLNSIKMSKQVKLPLKNKHLSKGWLPNYYNRKTSSKFTTCRKSADDDVEENWCKVSQLQTQKIFCLLTFLRNQSRLFALIQFISATIVPNVSCDMLPLPC